MKRIDFKRKIKKLDQIEEAISIEEISYMPTQEKEVLNDEKTERSRKSIIKVFMDRIRMKNREQRNIVQQKFLSLN